MGIEVVDQDAMESATYLLGQAFEPKYRRMLVKLIRSNNRQKIDRHIRQVAKALSSAEALTRPDRFTEQLVRDVCDIIDYAISNSELVNDIFQLGELHHLCSSLIEGECWWMYDPSNLPTWLREK